MRLEFNNKKYVRFDEQLRLQLFETKLKPNSHSVIFAVQRKLRVVCENSQLCKTKIKEGVSDIRFRMSQIQIIGFVEIASDFIVAHIN